ncbi:hypothetical protein Pfo_028886 [Paulownia fortunei]|nr:hypothetical protein Pfo_028886 [Paulownia fortunei]
MASHLEKKNDYETTEAAVQPNVGSGEQEDSQNQEGSPIIKWSQEFNCFTINGVLAPIPLTSVPLETGLKDEFYYHRDRQFRSFVETAAFILYSSKLKDLQLVSTAETSQEAEAAEAMIIISSSEACINLGSSNDGTLKENKHSDGLVYESNKRWKVGVYDLAPGDHVVLPMLEDPTPPIFQKKFEFSLQERLVGWTVEKRKRGNGKEDKVLFLISIS